MRRVTKIVLGVIVAVVAIVVVYGYKYLAYGIGIMNVSNNNVYKEYASESINKFIQLEYVDEETGLTLFYNLYVSDNYDEEEEYPLILYIGDSSTVGDDVTKPLGQEGALVWASEAEQEKHSSFVLVPQYPEVILDDHGGFTKTEYVDMTARLVNYVSDIYSIDTDRIYGTGQSMDV